MENKLVEQESDLPFTPVDGEDITMVLNDTHEKLIPTSLAVSAKIIDDVQPPNQNVQSQDIQHQQMDDTADTDSTIIKTQFQGLSEHLTKQDEEKVDLNLIANCSEPAAEVKSCQTMMLTETSVILTREAEMNDGTASTMLHQSWLQNHNAAQPAHINFEANYKQTLHESLEVGSQNEMSLDQTNSCSKIDKPIDTQKSLGLALLASYSDGDDSEDDDLPNENQKNSLQVNIHGLSGTTLSSSYRDAPSSSDDESDSSSDESCLTMPVSVCNDESDGAEDDIDVDQKETPTVANKSNMLKDLGILELAPLEDLKISVPEEECIPIGTVQQIIDCLVVVNAKKGCPAIDLDSVLFFDHGRKTLGQVFDVFGPVSEPMYMVRFNSAQHILDQGVELGMEVFFAPRTRHTAFVFIDNLFKQRGSDASWENDQEPPENCLDYSDDEQERQARAAHRLKKKTLDPNQPQPIPRRKRQYQRQQGARGGGHHQRGQHPPHNPFYMSTPPTFSAYQPSSAASGASNTNLWQANNSNHSSAVDRSSGSVLATPIFSPHAQFSGPQHYQTIPPPNSSYMFPPPTFSPFHSAPHLPSVTSRQDISPKNPSAEPPPPGV